MAATLHADAPSCIERLTPRRSTSQPVNRNAKAAANCVTAARSPKSLSVHPKSAIISGLRIAMMGRSIALKIPAMHSTIKSDQRRVGERTPINFFLFSRWNAQDQRLLRSDFRQNGPPDCSGGPFQALAAVSCHQNQRASSLRNSGPHRAGSAGAGHCRHSARHSFHR